MTFDFSSEAWQMQNESAFSGGHLTDNYSTPIVRRMEITAHQIEVAARILAHREEFNENRWPKYAEVAERMLRAALAVAR
jgi:shikimate kinase